MTELRFAKYHGTGNDFVMVEDLDGALDLSPEAIAAICHRRFGVGGDGLIRVLRGDDGADFFMDYYNADGSTAEMCGNGIRCLGKLVFDRDLTDATELIVDTRAGRKTLQLGVRDGRVTEVTVDMGAPKFTRAEIPMRGPAWETFQQESVESGDRTFKASAVSMGNPHLVLFIDGDPAEVDVGSLGPALENDDRFPEKTNVEFVVPGADGVLNARVWERGSGETMACGTGACAVLVAANEAGLAPAKATVRFPGGDLVVERRDDGNVTLAGPAVMVFDGVLTID